MIYRGIFTKEKLSDFKNSKLAFKDGRAVLQEIKSSFKSEKVKFNVTEREVVLSYFLFEEPV